MIVECKSCKRRYRVNKSALLKKGGKVRCTGCGLTFKAFLTPNENGVSFNDLSLAKKIWGDNVIAISNQKGGVAKTSTCLNLGVSLSMMKKKVLMIDFDIQANLTQLSGYQNTPSFYDILNAKNKKIDDIVIQTRYKNLFLLPSSRNMMVLNKWLFGAIDYEYVLKDRLASIKDKFDYILIDTPPSIDFFTINALTASSLVLIPSQCDYFSIRGMDQLIGIIKMVKTKLNPTLDTGILITMFDRKSRASKMVYDKIIELHRETVFKTKIELDELIKEAQLMSQPVIFYNKKSSSGIGYLNLAKEILKREAA